MTMTDKKRSAGVFLVVLVGLFAGFALLAGPASAEVSGGAHADDTSVASGNATAIDGSTASGDATAIGGSVASGCSEATDESTASGAPPHCPKAAAPAPHHGPAKATPTRSLALTGSSDGPLAAGALVAIVVGAMLVAATTDRRRHALS